MASKSWFLSKKIGLSNGASNSAFKWTSETNSSKRSTPIQNFSTWKQPSPFSLFNNIRQGPKSTSVGNQVIKVVDDKRIRTLPISSYGVQKTKSNVGKEVKFPSWYGSNGRSLVKPASVSFSPVKFTRQPSPKFNSKQQSTSRKKSFERATVVSRYKVVRNSAPSTTGNPSRILRTHRIGKINSASKSGLIPNLVTKYTIRRRTSASSSTPVKKRFWTPNYKTTGYWRRGIDRGDLVNRFKIVRRTSDLLDKKKRYKLDRRRESKFKMIRTRVFRQEAVQNAVKCRLKRSLVLNNVRNGARQSQDRHCLFYIRYGRCCRGPSCQFIHDAEKVAICTRFLRGTCKVSDCPFSHVVSPDKMPLCRFFLLGNCNRSDCPYLHVKHGESTANCADFERGYCPKGAKCDKKHIRKERKPKRPIAGKVDEGAPISLQEPIVKRGGAGSGVFLAAILRQHLASRPKQPVSFDLSSGPLPEFIPLERKIEN